jgi:ParB/RepB/Spo0J family partition protein
VEPLKISIADIDISGRGRKEFKDLERLSESIKQHGFIHPIVVDKNENGKYTLIAGERRLRAALLAHITEVPITLRENTEPVELKQMELEENVQRSDLHWNEQVEILRQLDELMRTQEGSAIGSRYGSSGGWNIEKMAKLTGRSESAVGRDLKLARTLKDKPKIAAKIKDLPREMARKKMNVLLDEERLQRAYEGKDISTNYELENGPCERNIRARPDASVDLLIMDPPFACETMSEVGTGRGGAGYAEESVNMNGTGDMRKIYLDLFPELFRVLKPGSHCYIFHAMESNHEIKMLLRDNDFTVDDMPLIWYKKQTTSLPSSYHYRPCYEAIIFAIRNPRDRPLMNPRANVIECSPINPDKRIHPLQKPEELLRTLIDSSSSLGDTILDCFAGSGSTLKTALKMHRHAVGYELDKGNYLRALENLKEFD